MSAAVPGGPRTAPSLTMVRGAKGHFRILVKHPNGKTKDVTLFRGNPTQVTSFSSADPFGDSTAVLSFPQITSFDAPGSGDLWWLVPWANVTITWVERDGDRLVEDAEWSWEGNLVSEDAGSETTWSCKGALHMADNFQAAPFYPQYPVPYELLIKRALDPKTHPTLRNKALAIEYPAGWNVTVPAFNEPAYLWFLRPWGVSKGQKWSGLTTRSTGSWEPSLTGFVQTLLATMFTPEGDQWTVMSRKGRLPVLQVRDPLREAAQDTLVVFNGAPGVQPSLSRDFTQSANVIYGAGTDLAGTAFSGAQVSTDGETTYYEPFAALPQVHPASASNPRLIPTMTRKESRITFPQGIDEIAARDVAATQIRRFADPGWVGSISLESDPFKDGQPFNRMLIRAGAPILLKNFRGTDVLLHISTVTVSPAEGTVSLQVDSKFRDALTVAEVRARTRDALDPVNLLQVGKQSTTVQDLLKPWSYAGGSGVIPSGSTLDATPLFKKMEADTRFPWSAYTKKYPPSKYPKYYIKVSRKGPKADDRWQDNGYTSKRKRSQSVPIKAAQNGTIRLLQLGAFDRNGNPKKVKFHFSIYTNSGVTSSDMPTVPKDAKKQPYAAGQHYPFFPGAFEQNEANGEEQDNPGVLLPQGADLVAGWGNSFDPAGYSPGLFSAGGKVTGRLIDETTWSFDTSGDPSFDKYSVANNAKNKSAGMLYCMIFCDDPSETYFLGRMFNTPAGAQ